MVTVCGNRMGHETQSRITKTHYQQLYASEPIYELCIYMSALKNFSNFHVSEMDLDDCTNVMYICADPIPRIAMLNVCFQQVSLCSFTQLNTHHKPASVVCGMQSPKGFTTFLYFKKLPIPEVAF
ncbi:hypothetical protein CAEBREN_16466 [Caenorhabditis brenneri]|uniref:Uncharacterized protein n=1 Tax=Caenorhabditis brenneri TaxID=135651 RepID=G0NKR6_CAEBE|nr:hypothetical protein CAEBREN_16466 [Caenorhabditis brenneri]